MWQSRILFGQGWRSKRWFGAFANFVYFNFSCDLDAYVVAAFHFHNDNSGVAEFTSRYKDALVDFAFARDTYNIADVAVCFL